MVNLLDVKFKRLFDNAVCPTFSKIGDAGADLIATTKTYYADYIEYGTGIAIEIPTGYVGLLFPRSSCSNYSQILSNCVGVIDSNYRGEVKFRFKQLGVDKIQDLNKIYNIGDKIGQLIITPIPEIKYVEVNSLSQTDRGSQGFGSSGT